METPTYESLCLKLGRLLDYKPYYAPTPSEFINRVLASEQKNIPLLIHGANIMAVHLEMMDEGKE